MPEEEKGRVSRMSDLSWQELERQIRPEVGDLYILEVRAQRYIIHRYDGQTWEQLGAGYSEQEIQELIAPMQFLGSTKGQRRYYRPTRPSRLDEPKIEITSYATSRYRLFSWYSKETVVLTAADLLDLARWVEQHREILENEL